MKKLTDDGYLVTDKHVFFYKKWLSNFEICKFLWSYTDNKRKVHTGTFVCTEQAFMWAKALHFGDLEIAYQIYQESHAEKPSPGKCKKLGRQVKNYNDEEWSKVRYEVMRNVNLVKYRQNKDLRKKLFDPDFHNKTFVEASPTDKIWGIGRGENYPDIDDETKWLGRNLLGKAITAVRKTLIHDR